MGTVLRLVARLPSLGLFPERPEILQSFPEYYCRFVISVLFSFGIRLCLYTECPGKNCPPPQICTSLGVSSKLFNVAIRHKAHYKALSITFWKSIYIIG